MTLDAKDRMHKLRAEIAAHARAYYELDAPTISDAAYDSLVVELRALDAAHPEWADLNFVIYRVGGAPLDVFTKAEHSTRMLSLSDAFSYDEIRAWDARIRKLLDGQTYTYFCELKLDGLAISLIYEEGILVRAVTRGDGSIGEDVTQNAKTIESIPLQISDKRTIEVRGEVVMSKATLIRLNKKYEKEGRQLLANTRNAAAGSLRQLDPAITRERTLDFFAWDCLDQSISHHSDKHKLLARLGFTVARDEAVCTSLEEVEAFIEVFEKKRDAERYIEELGANTQGDITEAAPGDVVVPIILKTDVFGTAEAIEREIKKIQVEGLYIKLIHKGIGAINESDIRLAQSDKTSLILGFNVSLDARAQSLNETVGASVQTFTIIYKLTEWLAEELEQRRPRIETRKVIGSAKVLKVFSKTKDRQVIGCRVDSGVLSQGAKVSIIRREHPLTQGTIVEIQQAKQKVREIGDGECGMQVECKNDIAPGDVLEAFMMVRE